MKSRHLSSSLLFALLAISVSASAAKGDLVFRAALDASQVTGSSTESGTAFAEFILDKAGENLSYSVQMNGLNLVESAAARTEFSDIDKIHLHNGLVGETGGHVLNIFGLPSEDDDQLVVDYANNSFTGNYDDGDAIDPDTGQLFDQNSPLTTKLLSNFVDDLQDGQIYIAVHTIGQGGGIAIRGQLVAVPEPSSLMTLFFLGASLIVRRRRHQLLANSRSPA